MKHSISLPYTFFLMACLVGAIEASAARAKPNVVILFADDMGIGDLSCYGARDVRTMHLDELARRGLRFTNFYSAAPVCSPSRAALLTGRYPIRAGVPGNAPSNLDLPGMPARERTVAELVKTAGYATGLIGKWHLGTILENRPNAQGFDQFFGHLAGCIDYWSHMFYYNRNAVPRHDLWRDNTEVFEFGKNMTDLIGREATRFIDEHRDGPFLLYVPFNAPHYPMQAPRRLVRQFADLKMNRREYLGHVAHLDETIGKILDRLRHHKIIDDTIIFFLSDNGHSVEARAHFGGGSAGPYRGHKFSLFEGGIHMPFFVSYPNGLPQNETRDQISIAMDILPTILELTGVHAPGDLRLDGRSILPVLKENAPAKPRSLHWQFGKQSAVRNGKWKLVVNPRQDIPKVKLPEIFLTNLEQDPGERHNLAKEYPEVVTELKKRHAAWLADVKNP